MLELEWTSGYIKIIYPRKYEQNCCFFNTDLVKNGYQTSDWNKSLE